MAKRERYTPGQKRDPNGKPITRVWISVQQYEQLRAMKAAEDDRGMIWTLNRIVREAYEAKLRERKTLAAAGQSTPA